MEYITINDALIGAGALSGYEIKSVTVAGEDFSNDEVYKALKFKADKAYKELEDYKFRKRWDIKK